MSLSEQAKRARREYMRQYRQKNKAQINQRQRERYQADPEKHRRYQQEYWEKQGSELSSSSEES